MSAYTNIPKPTNNTYVNVNKAFSDISLYGSAIYGTSKYGIINNYTAIPKPIGSGLNIKAGMTIGLLIPLTNTKITNVGNPYTNIPKPT